MWVVPIKGDVIKTVDGLEFTVDNYTNFKQKGPAVYVESESGEKTMSFYFFDIAQVNGIKVEFNNNTKVFTALGYMKRKIHIPQKHDTIKVQLSGEEDPIKVVVKDVKLHNKNLGLSRGLLIIGKDDQVYSLHDIIDIKRVSGDSFFDAKKFQKIYKDYLGYREKQNKLSK